MERDRIHSRVQTLVEQLRKNPHTTGVWSLLDLEEQGVELVISQYEDQSAQLAVFRQNKETEILQGKIVSKRLQTGHPIRQELFIANNGEKEVSIRTSEF